MAKNIKDIDFIKLSNLQTFANEVKTKYATETGLNSLTARVDALAAVGSQANVIEGVKVNGSLLTLINKIADILVAEGTTNGTIAVNNVDIAVHGLAALAYKSEVAEADLATALKNAIDAKAAQSSIDTLLGEGDGSIAKMIDDAIDDFATKVSNDDVVNSYKELIDCVAEHGAEAATMTANISANATAITNLKNYVGTIPEGATATTIVGYIAEAISALSIGDYAKTSEVTETLKSYYTKTEIDTTFAEYVKSDDIETVDDATVAALFADVEAPASEPNNGEPSGD